MSLRISRITSADRPNGRYEIDFDKIETYSVKDKNNLMFQITFDVGEESSGTSDEFQCMIVTNNNTSIEDVTKIVSECRFFEYMVTDQSANWLVHDTHMNELIVSGRIDLFVTLRHLWRPKTCHRTNFGRRVSVHEIFVVALNA